MTKSRRKTIGLALMMLSILTVPLLAFAGVPLLSNDSVYFVDTGVTTHSLRWHWPIAAAGALFVAGATLTLLPGSKRGT